MGAQLALEANLPFAADEFFDSCVLQSADLSPHKLKDTRRAIRVVGVLFYLGALHGAFAAIVCGLMSIGLAANGPVATESSATLGWFDLGLLSVFWACWCVLLTSVAWGLRRFDRQSANWAKGISILLLLAVPAGTVVGVVFLISLHNRFAKHLWESGGLILDEADEFPAVADRPREQKSSVFPVVLLLMVLLVSGLLGLLILA
ncbi:hypothetical protein NG895_07910 [Aeoliella sp. ICT_H6.2]|uniref:Uncharacterized protein n=1 Tax=Aeoliella straminimaris TaxID=2954799 RepID=A0A9X2F7T7_9BACT|nr:hypothetical protein [Aeoliella straminimaris]MCO6043830.1 hypothetical protein [Aeoliella straminimaris]